MENIGNVISPLDSDEEEAEDGEDEESSSSSPGLEDQLVDFRKQWKAELTSKEAGETGKSRGRRRTKSSSSLGDGSSTLDDKAYNLFMQGVGAEKNGHMFEAIKFYRQAMQLVPDIESKIQSYSGFDDSSSSDSDELDDVDEELGEISSQLSTMSLNNLKMTCEKEFPQTSTHISKLPLELLILVFRWVVSSDLDLRSLEQLSLVCRGFYVCGRDQEIWRLVCQRIWGSTVYLTKEYLSWRNMFIHRPHLRFDGVYICRMTYIRQGEQSYIDQTYKPWYFVEYYRFVRVFPDGMIIMLTSPEEPREVVSRLRSKFSSGEGFVKGHYRLVGNTLSAVLQRQKEKETETEYQRYKRRSDRNNNNSVLKKQIFRVEFELTGTNRCNNIKLLWKHYSCETTYGSSSVASVSEFDISSFNPLLYSRVKSYTKTAISPL